MVVRAKPIPSSTGRIRITAAVLFGLLVFGCSLSPPPSGSNPPPLTGGTLRVAVVANGTEAVPGAAYYDPAIVWSFSPLYRCCLLRTLLSYNGRPIEEGGAELRPDLAADLPHVSADGLTWTFRLKPDIRYAPPLDERVIESADFVTALEYAVRYGDPYPMDDIVGVAEYRDGAVDTIAGLEAPDPTTLVIHLVAPASDLGNRMATSAAAPIPAEALAGREEQGYAGFVVASGPYMYEGAESLDLSDPDAEPIWSGREGSPVVLVPNPSWDRASDRLRGAYVDRIEVSLAPDPASAAALVDAGDADVMGEPAPLDILERYRNDPALEGRVFTQSAGRVQYLPLNIAQPPFDDVHVRRAVNLVLDRAAAVAALEEARGQPFVVANHAFPDNLLSNLLLRYAPYASSDDRGDLRAAQDEIRESTYDRDEDGSCDAAACDDVPVAVVPETEALFDLVAADLAEIGISIVPTDRDIFDPREHVAAIVGIGWGVDLPTATNFAGLLLGGGLPGEEANVSLLGATPEQLAAWGYEVADVPTIDASVEACVASVGSAGFECWAEIDQLVMERVVAWAPIGFAISGWITSDRVAAFSADANSVTPALDQIQLRPGS
jgi:peptide/nickel transport system substrate-binding protein